MNDKFEWIWKHVACPNHGNITGFYLERLRKIVKNLSQYSQCTDQDLNQPLPKY